MSEQTSSSAKAFISSDTGKIRIVSKKTTKQVVSDDEADTVVTCVESLEPETGEYECFSVEHSYPDHISDSVVHAQTIAMEPIKESLEESKLSVKNFAKALKGFIKKRRNKRKSEEIKHEKSEGSDSSPNLGVTG